MRKFKLLLVVFFVSCTASMQAAPPLADRVPGDALFYVGWAGTEALGPKYDQSHLKAIVDASAMPRFFDEFVPQLIRRVGQDNREAANVMRQIVDIGAPLWKHPTAIYFGGIDWNGPMPAPKLAILCDAGADAQPLADRIGKLLKDAQKDNAGPFPIVKVYGSMVVFAFGSPAAIDQTFGAENPDSITKAAKFTEALGQAQSDPAFIEYIDCPAIVQMVDDVLQKKADATITERWTRSRDSLGLTGLHQIIATAGFEGRDWAAQAFVGTSDRDTGILTLFHSSPLSPELLKAIPKTADSLVAGKFDLDGFVGHARDIVAQLDPPTGEQVDEAIANINQVAGLDIRKDFLAMLGDEWACYSDRTIAGPGLLGTVVVNRPHDADATDKALTQLSRRLNAIIAQAMNQPRIKIEFHEEVINGLTLHYLAIPLVTPCWAISDGNLYFGLYPQVVSAAVEQVKRGGASILDRPEYQAVMKRLGDHPAAGVQFYNLPATAADSYTGLLMISRLYVGIADVLGVHPPAMMIPPLGKIMPELSPSGAVTWTDSLGMHSKSITPFPGAEMVAGASLFSGAIVGEEAMIASIMLPSLNKARETANRAKCASNEHQIGLALLLYTNDNQGKLPDDLGTLLKTEQLTANVFLCPSGSTALPANFETMTPDEKAKWVNDNADDVYLGKGLNQGKMDATHIVLYEKEGAHGGDGMNMLFGDGHVEFFKTDLATKMIHDQEGK